MQHDRHSGGAAGSPAPGEQADPGQPAQGATRASACSRSPCGQWCASLQLRLMSDVCSLQPAFTASRFSALDTCCTLEHSLQLMPCFFLLNPLIAHMYTPSIALDCWIHTSTKSTCTAHGMQVWGALKCKGCKEAEAWGAGALEEASAGLPWLAGGRRGPLAVAGRPFSPEAGCCSM